MELKYTGFNPRRICMGRIEQDEEGLETAISY